MLKTAKVTSEEYRTIVAQDPERVMEGGVESFSWRALRACSKEKFLVGYLSYDLAEALTGLNRGRGGLSGFWFGVYDRLRVRDERTREWSLWTPDGKQVPARDAILPRPSPFSLEFCGFDQSKADYLDSVARIREAIEGGHVYQVNHTLRGSFRFEGDPYGLFEEFLHRQPVSFGAYIQTGRRTFVSGSPELFLRIRGGVALSRPMKGTARLAAGARRTLFLSEKERAGNVMITDLMRNDLGKVAALVEVPRLFRVERYRTLYQMVSTVKARLLPETIPWDVVEACFPPGSVTGAPKSTAMEMIARLESSPRGLYTGAIGYSTPWEEGCFSVAIRNCEIEDRVMTYGTGGGITYASDPEEEWEECLLKMRALSQGTPA